MFTGCLYVLNALWLFYLMDGFALLLCLACLLLLVICAWLGWPISLTYHMLECIVCWLFTITQVVVIANALFLLVCSNHPLFDDAKRRKIRMTMRVCVIPWISWPSWQFFFAIACSCVTCIQALTDCCSLMTSQYGHLVCHNQKGEICWTHPYISHKVLMITNTNAIYTWVCWSNKLNMVFVLHWNCLTNLTQEQVENMASISGDARTSEHVWEQLSKVFCNNKKNPL